MKREREFIGIYHQLIPLFVDLNRQFFNETIEATVRWGNNRARTNNRVRKASIRLGSYHPKTRVILIHPCLDQAIVPAICVERILFHEMAHQYLPSKVSPNGKNIIHHKEFRDFEKTYPYLKEADLWLKINLPRLLSY